VAHVRGRFRYFCGAACRDRYDMNATGTPLPVPREGHEERGWARATVALPSEAGPRIERPVQGGQGITRRPVTDLPSEHLADVERLPDEHELALPVSEVTSQRGTPALAVDVGGVLLLLAVLGAVLSVALILAGDSSLAEAARLTVTFVAALSLAAEVLMGAREPTDLHPAALLAAPLAASAIALSARLLALPHTGTAITLASVIIGGSAASAAAMRRTRRAIDAERNRI